MGWDRKQRGGVYYYRCRRRHHARAKSTLAQGQRLRLMPERWPREKNEGELKGLPFLTSKCEQRLSTAISINRGC